MHKSEHMKSSLFFAISATLVLASAAYAQQPEPSLAPAPAPQPMYSPTGTSPVTGSTQQGGIPLGPITAYPSVNLGVQRNDNLFYNPNNKTADTIEILNPAVRLEAKQGNNTYSLDLGTTIGRYNTSTADNYDDYNANGLANFDITGRLRARVRLDYLDSHDPRGSTNNAISTTPDRWRQTYAQGIISYGALGAKGRVDFELGQLRRDYYNNRVNTALNDRVVDDVGATFYWRIAPKTSLLVQGKHSKFDYTNPGSTLDSTENRLLGGVTWEATAKTTGVFKIGTVKKDFNDASRTDFSGVSWEGQILWSPLTYSHVNFNLSKTPVETTGAIGNFIDKTTTGAVWTHDWSSRVTTDVSASYMNDQYKGLARTDKIQNFGLRATYKMRRWLNFGADYSYTNRNSDDNNFDYQRNLFMLFVRATL